MAFARLGAQPVPELKVKPVGRVLLDAGYFESNVPNTFNSSFAIPDARMGFKAEYEDWRVKAEIAYAYGRLSVKDVYLQKYFGDQCFLRAGYFDHQYGLQSAPSSSSMKVTMEEPGVNDALYDGRLLGLMFVYNGANYFGTASLYNEEEVMKLSTNALGKVGVGALTRQVWRPMRDDGNIFQLGLSAGYATPQYHSNAYLNHSHFLMAATYPTRIAKVTAVEAEIDRAVGQFRFSPELLFARGRVAFEAQYYYNQVFRNEGAADFKAQGMYATLRTLLQGEAYSYTGEEGGIDTPASGSMELVFNYNHTNLDDASAQIYGGKMNDYSATFSYYLNKYMIWRVRGSYTDVRHHASPNNHLWAFVTRLQIKF